MKNIKNIIAVMFLGTSVFAISMNFSGNFRTKASIYSKLGQNLGSVSQNKQYILGRFLLDPNLVIDDHFSVHSQWNLLNSPNLTPGANASIGAGNGNGGYVFGDTSTSTMNLTRVWLEWTSDFGVVRLGRMPISWGYGLLWDAGNGIWDNWADVRDRLEYRLHLGHVIGALAYSKPRKDSTLGQESDQDFYTIYLQYDNPELDVEGGIIYEKQVRSTSQASALMTTASPYRLPSGFANKYPMHTRVAYALSNNVIDVYFRKTITNFTFGGEIAWLTGSGTDYGGNGRNSDLNAFGTMLNLAYENHKVKAFIDFLYASGEKNMSGNDLRGFVLLNRNRSPGLIMGNELLGPYTDKGAGFGSHVVYGNAGSFSGVYYIRPGFRVDWSPSLASGIEVIWAKKAVTQSGEEALLGTEIDIGTDYNVYKNFDLGLNLGFLFPGKGIQVTAPAFIFAAMTTTSLKF